MEQLQWEMYELRKSNASLLGNADTNAQLRRGSSSSTRTSKLKLLKKELQCCLCYDKQADTFLYRLKLAWLSFYLLLFHTSYLIENLRGYSSKMTNMIVFLEAVLRCTLNELGLPPPIIDCEHNEFGLYTCRVSSSYRDNLNNEQTLVLRGISPESESMARKKACYSVLRALQQFYNFEVIDFNHNNAFVLHEAYMEALHEYKNTILIPHTNLLSAYSSLKKNV
ncbi:uncharacterized protein [Euphorbia lathyris]|uniref:uncharacterized protein isoform X1 n=1 Tax=Euphorbia lathyris TaxID=212925 RepID=UPI00331414B4